MREREREREEKKETERQKARFSSIALEKTQVWFNLI